MGSSDVAPKVAVIASSPDQRQYLQVELEKNGIEVVINEAADRQFLQKLSGSGANVLLINVSDDDSEEVDAIIDEIVDALSDDADIPILFNDVTSMGANASNSKENVLQKLVEKLNETVSASNVVEPEWNQAPHPLARESSSSLEIPSIVEPPVLTAASRVPEKNSVLSEYNVWVLGASLGGPQAVRQFLSSIDADLPVTFILAQHIGANHVTLLAEQLDRVTKFKVIPGRTGHKISHHEVILTPADKQLTFTGDGYLSLKPSPPSAIYSPSIDNVMMEVAKTFGARSGTIVFSGMGDDGAKGCKSIAENGGVVWAQDIASCVVSSMPDHARKTGTVSYSAKPEDLAHHLHEHYH